MKSFNIPYIVGKGRDGDSETITVAIDGKTHTFPNTSPQYSMLVKAIKSRDELAVREAVDYKAATKKASNGRVEFVNGQVHFDGVPLHNALANRVSELFRNGFDVGPLCRFMENLEANPSKRAVDELYGFLEACSLPITEDGYFLAYKMIRGDYTDLYSGTMDNSVGAIVSMSRNKVDDEKTRTCSQGLHFASRHYVESGGYGAAHRGNRLVVLKINPANVVSIPVDYNNSKGRACEYEILEEIEWSEEIPTFFGRRDTVNSDYNESWWDDDEFEDEDGGAVLVSAPIVDTQAEYTAKLTEDDVLDIDARLDEGESLTSLAAAYGVSRRQIARIRDGEAWSHVTGR